MTLLEMSLSATLLLISVMILRFFFKNKIPKQTFLFFWGIVILKLVIPSSWLSHLNIRNAMTPSQALEYEFMGMGPELLEPFIGQNGFTLRLPEVLTMTGVLFLWGAGVIAMALFLLVPHFRSLQTYKMSLPVKNVIVDEWQKNFQLKRQIQVRQSEFLLSPLTYGILKPVILLPKTLDFENKEELTYILTHEYMHIKRFDIVFKWLIVLTLCLHWFNPLVWLMYSLINRDIELACDDAVVLSLGKKLKASYAVTLINLEERRSSFTSFAMYFSKSAVEERVESIMKIQPYSKWRFLFSVSIVGVMMLLTSQLTIDLNVGALSNVKEGLTIESEFIQATAWGLDEEGNASIIFEVNEEENTPITFELFNEVSGGNQVMTIHVIE